MSARPTNELKAVRPSSSRALSNPISPHHAALRLLNRARARGWSEASGDVWGNLRSRWSSRGTLLILWRTTQVTIGDPHPDVAFRWAERDDAAAYARDIGTDSIQTFRARLSGGTRCFLGAGGNRLVHASWVTTSGAWIREIERWITPSTGAAYIFESFTRPEMRGRGIYPAALAGILDALGGDGSEEAWIGVEESNTASIRSIQKAGFTEAFRVHYERRRWRSRLSPPEGPRAADAVHLLKGGGGDRPEHQGKP